MDSYKSCSLLIGKGVRSGEKQYKNILDINVESIHFGVIEINGNIDVEQEIPMLIGIMLRKGGGTCKSIKQS